MTPSKASNGGTRQTRLRRSPQRYDEEFYDGDDDSNPKSPYNHYANDQQSQTAPPNQTTTEVVHRTPLSNIMRARKDSKASHNNERMDVGEEEDGEAEAEAEAEIEALAQELIAMAEEADGESEGSKGEGGEDKEGHHHTIRTGSTRKLDRIEEWQQPEGDGTGDTTDEEDWVHMYVHR